LKFLRQACSAVVQACWANFKLEFLPPSLVRDGASLRRPDSSLKFLRQAWFAAIQACGARFKLEIFFPSLGGEFQA
jgi:hypothetical protein